MGWGRGSVDGEQPLADPWLEHRIVSLVLLVNVPGFGIGKWVSHFGAAVTVLVTLLMMGLLFFHPHASAAHPHVNPQSPFSLEMPMLTLFSLNLFSKIAFNALTGLEQVAVFAGETRHAGKTIMWSAWIAAPLIAVIYILMTGSMLAYIPAAKVDLTGPIPQIAGGCLWRGDGGRRRRLGFDAGARDHPGAGHCAGGAVCGDCGGDQPAADGGGMGRHRAGVVYAA